MFERRELEKPAENENKGREDEVELVGHRRQWGQEEGPPVAALLHEKQLQTATYAVRPEGGGMEGNETRVVFSRPEMAAVSSGDDDELDLTPKPTDRQLPSIDEDNLPTPVPAGLQATPIPSVIVGTSETGGDGRQDGVTPTRLAWDNKEPHILVTPKSSPSVGSGTVIVKTPSLDLPRSNVPTPVLGADPEVRDEPERGEKIEAVEEEGEKKPPESDAAESSSEGGKAVGEGEHVPKVESSGSWVLVGSGHVNEGREDSAATEKVDSEAEVGDGREAAKPTAKEAWTGATGDEQVAISAVPGELQDRAKDDVLSVEDIEVQESTSHAPIPEPKTPPSIPSTSLEPIPIPAEYLPVTVETPSRPNTSLGEEEEFFTPTGHDLLPKVSLQLKVYIRPLEGESTIILAY